VRLRGAYGTVYQALLPSEPWAVALKVIDLPRGLHDAATLADLYAEVAIMAALRDQPRACRLLDFGVAPPPLPPPLLPAVPSGHVSSLPPY